MNPTKRLIIAIDGHSSCGKSTLAKALAKKLGYVFVDSGAMYRGVTLYALRNGLITNGMLDEKHLIESLNDIRLEFVFNTTTEKSDLLLNNENVEQTIRQPEVAAHVSKVAAIKEVRKKLVHEQQIMGQNGGLVMDGRDIGTVVFPHADMKFFVTATADVRAHRRHLELSSTGIELTLEEVKRNLIERDELDSSRAESPLIQASDAILLDTTHLTQEEQLDEALTLIQQKTGDFNSI
jgi:cytidylate kinase